MCIALLKTDLTHELNVWNKIDDLVIVSLCLVTKSNYGKVGFTSEIKCQAWFVLSKQE
jgi:hypothetical protein